MKKYILSTALLLVLCCSANAQFNLGIKGGVNFSTINTNDFKNSSVTGYQAGVFARVGGLVYLQPELYVTGTGGHIESNDNGFGQSVRLTSLNIPLLLGYRFGARNFNLRIMAGPDYNYIMNTSESFTQNLNLALYGFGQIKNNSVGYQAGFGIDVSSITVDLRYQASFNNTTTGDYNPQPHVWALSVGFKIL